MEDIRLYTFDGTLLHIENEIVTSNWTLKYNDIGTFEAHFPLMSDIVPFCMENPYIIAVQGDKQAIITGRQANTEFIIYGRTLNWILQKRTIDEFKTSELIEHGDISKKDVETVARWIVTQGFTAYDDSFYLGDIVGFTNEIDFWRNTRHPVFDAVRDCLANDSAGHEVYYDFSLKRWVFQVLKGAEITTVFSEPNRNAYETEYSEDFLDYASSGWYEEQQEPEQNPDGTQGETPDPIWKEITSDPTKTGIYRWECILSPTTESEAASELNAKQMNRKTQAKLKGLKFGADYRLGDTVRVQKQIGKWKSTETKRITGVNIWYENNNIGEQPIFEEDSI